MPLRFVTFVVGDQLYGLDILWVREIVRNFEVTPVDRAPPYIAGLVNLRGQILTVFDMRAWLKLPALPEHRSDCVVLKNTTELERLAEPPSDASEGASDLVGLRVDRIGDVLELPDKALESPPGSRKPETAWIRGVVPLDSRLLIVLKPGVLLSSDTAPSLNP